MPARKRSAPDAEAATSSRRRSGRISSTPRKPTAYTDPASDSELDELPPKKKRGRSSKAQVIAKDDSSDDQYQDAAKEDSSEDQYEDEPADEADEQDGGGDDEEDDDDSPPRVEIIPHVKMRDTGGVEYTDEKVHKNTLLFLKDLKANNQRSWLKSHDDEYRRALKDWQSFVEVTTQNLIEVDETVPELPFKDVIFRIHRDIRFSKDPTPYKPHFSAAWSRTGRKGPYACYYIHCEPGSSFIGGGLWHPEAQYVRKLRRSIDRHPERWYRALSRPEFKRVFFPKVKGGAAEKEMVKAFAEKNKESALKKRPMDYAADHRDIELLKLKSYTVGTSIPADMLCADDAQEKVGEIISALLGFVTFLNSIVMPDPGAEDESEEEEEEADEED